MEQLADEGGCSPGFRFSQFWTRHGQAYLFMLPAVMLAAGISLYPILYATYLSLFRTRYLEKVAFVGLGNYQQLWADPAAWQNLIHSLQYVFGSLAVVLPFGLGVAVLLNQRIRYRAIFRTFVILPWVVSQTILALLWGWLLNPDFGPAMYLLHLLGVGKLSLLSDVRFALPTLIGVNAWGSYPMAVILLLAALQTIPVELVEASRVDGASRWQYFLHVMLPLIRPTLMVTTIMLLAPLFQHGDACSDLDGWWPIGNHGGPKPPGPQRGLRLLAGRLCSDTGDRDLRL